MRGAVVVADAIADSVTVQDVQQESTASGLLKPPPARVNEIAETEAEETTAVVGEMC